MEGDRWHGRFDSTRLDESHLYAAVRYVEKNPVRAGIVKKLHRYKWSSANSHIHKEKNPILSHGCYLEEEIVDWSEYLKGKDDEQIIENIRKCSMTGMPCGNDSFLKRLEKLFGRRLRALPWGRPRKSNK